jgi:RNA methyltransferase, TrmH family
MILSRIFRMPAVEPIRSRSHPLVRHLQGLKRRSERELCLIEGPKLLREALDAEVEIVEVAAAARVEGTAEAAALLSMLGKRGVPVRFLDDRLVESLSETETSQGFVALARRPTFPEAAILGRLPLVVVAVGVQDPGNLGGLLRTAEAAAATGACLTDGSADPFSWKALRGSMGSAFRLPHLRTGSASATMGWLRARRVSTVATVAKGGTPYTEAKLTGPVAILLGREGSGLPDEVMEQVDHRVTIALASPVESLNVGVAAGLLLFEAVRQRQRESGPQ